MACKSAAIAYPHPRHPRRSAHRSIRPAPGADPNFLTYSSRISTPPALLPRLRRSQACDPTPGKPSHPPILDTPTGY